VKNLRFGHLRRARFAPGGVALGDLAVDLGARDRTPPSLFSVGRGVVSFLTFLGGWCPLGAVFPEFREVMDGLL
jgi:hypothetical protein